MSHLLVFSPSPFLTKWSLYGSCNLYGHCRIPAFLPGIRRTAHGHGPHAIFHLKGGVLQYITALLTATHLLLRHGGVVQVGRQGTQRILEENSYEKETRCTAQLRTECEFMGNMPSQITFFFKNNFELIKHASPTKTNRLENLGV